MRASTPILVAAFATCIQGFSPIATTPRAASALGVTRKEFISAAVATTFAVATTTANVPAAFAADDTVTVEVKKKGTGPSPESGELVAIRFAAYTGGNKIDDIFDTPEPYYTRIGNGGLLKGVEQTLPSMRVGDRWVLTIPSSLAFGSKGRPASAGKPRIPGDAVVTFDVEMVGLPGKEDELIDILGE